MSAAAQLHIEDFDNGAVIHRNGVDVTAAWRSEYVDRIAKLDKLLEQQAAVQGE